MAVRVPIRKRPHKKTRSGCKTCRQRRVKCDETHPICSNCTKRRVECMWGDAELVINDPFPIQSPPSSSALPHSCISPIASLTLQLPAVPSFPCEPFDMNTLRLLHHYDTSGAIFPSDPADPDSAKLLKLLPPLGFAHEYLIHAILAVSALHLGLSASHVSLADDNHLTLADRLCQRTMAELVNTETMGIGENPERDAARFASWFLMMFYMLARPRPAVGSWTPKVLDFLSLARRCIRLFQSKGMLCDSSISYIFTRDLQSVMATNTTVQFPEALLDIHLPTSSAPDHEEVRDPAISNIYERAVSSLKVSFALDAQSSHQHLSSVCSWALAIPDAFHEFLKQQRPRALVILAHYCVILQRNAGSWWEKDVDDNIRKIAGFLDTSWLHFMNLSFSKFREEVIGPQDSGVSQRLSNILALGQR